MEIVRTAVIVALPLLAGCTLVDQRTFYPPTKPEPRALERFASLEQRPALTIRQGGSEPDWRPAVTALVEQTLARNPQAEFEVVAAIAPNDPTQEQTRAARDVAQAIGALGVPPSRTLLGLRTIEAGGSRFIHIFVR